MLIAASERMPLQPSAISKLKAPPRAVSVVVVDDHPIVLDGVRHLVDSTTWITLAGYARTGREGITLAEQTQPDVVMLDLCLPDMLGPEVVRGIHRGAPDTKIVLFTAHPDHAAVAPALAAGANLMLWPELTVNFCRARMLSPGGRCRTFDAAADGYVRGEGCGVVVLKRLSDARADGDRILALVRGSAVNHDGRSSGLTVPNGPAQEAVLRRALAGAGVRPDEVGYVEAHEVNSPMAGV